MKNFIKKCFITYPWVVAFSILIPSFVNKDWNTIVFFAQLLIAVVIIFVLQLLTHRFVSEFFLLEMVIEFLMIMAVIYILGWIWNWYTIEFAWMMVAIVLPVYVLAYIVGITRTKKDIEFINEKLNETYSDNEEILYDEF